MNCRWSVSFIAVLFASVQAVVSAIATSQSPLARTHGVYGDVTIAGLFPSFEFPTHSPASECSVSGYRGYGAINNAQAFSFVLERHGRTLSVRTNDGDWHNLSLGFVMADARRDMEQLASTEFSLRLIRSSPEVTKVCPGDGVTGAIDPIALVGSVSNAATEVIGPLLGQYGIPLISSQANTRTLSCAEGDRGNSLDCQHEYQYLYRTTPADDNMARALVDLAVHGIGTRVVGVIYEDDNEGRRNAGDFLAENTRAPRPLGRPWRLCVAFSEKIPSDDCCSNQRKRVVEQIRKYSYAKYIVLLAKSPAVFSLMESIVEDVTLRGRPLPHVWIGRDDQWGSREIIYNRGFVNATLSTVVHLRSRLPPLLDWFYQTVYKDFIIKSSYLSPEALSDQNSPLNRFLCSKLDQCVTGNRSVLRGSELLQSDEQTCNVTHTLISEINRNESYADQLGAVHTLLATEVIVQALNDVLQDFVQERPGIKQDSLPREFLDYAFGERFNTAISKVRLRKSSGCHLEEGCPIFSNTHELESSSFFILSRNLERQERTVIGLWTENTSSSGNSTIQLNPTSCSPLKFRNFSSELRDDMDGPQPECTPVCSAGEYVSFLFELPCCHICRPCTDGTFSNKTNSPLCYPCGEFYHANSNSTDCLPLPEVSPPHRVVWLCTFGIIWFTLLVVVGVTGRLFVANRRSKLIRRHIFFSYVLLVIMALHLLSVTPYAIAATNWLCKYRSLLTAPWKIASIAAILVRSIRFFRVMRMHRRASRFMLLRHVTSYRRPAQLLFISSFSCIGLLLLLVFTFAVFPPKGTKRISDGVSFYTVCHPDVGTDAVIDIYLIALLLIACGLSFNTRKQQRHRKILYHIDGQPVLFVTLSLSLMWIFILVIRSLSDGTHESVFSIIENLLQVGSVWVWIFLSRTYKIITRFEKRRPVVVVRM